MRHPHTGETVRSSTECAPSFVRRSTPFSDSLVSVIESSLDLIDCGKHTLEVTLIDVTDEQVSEPSVCLIELGACLVRSRSQCDDSGPAVSRMRASGWYPAVSLKGIDPGPSPCEKPKSLAQCPHQHWS